MAYHIIGLYQDRRPERIDEADTLDGAEYLLGEYRLAFGRSWTLYIEEDTTTNAGASE